MNPIDFRGSNSVAGKGQPEYQELPLNISPDSTRTATSCWRLSLRERLKLLFTGKLWLQIMTFGGPLQPQLPSVDNPIISVEPPAKPA